MAKQRGLKSRRLPPCGPVDVAAAWKRIEACLHSFSPYLSNTLAAGAKEKDLLAAEKAFRRQLPEEVRQSFLAHNGQRGEERSVFYGLEFCSLKQTRGSWKLWAELGEIEELKAEHRDRASATPKGTIQLGYANRNWIQLLNTGGSNYFGIDLGPGEKGLRGQVITFGRDEEHKVVLAWSWGWFLNDLAEELERGNFRFHQDEPEDGVVARQGLVLIDPAPPHHYLFNVTKEWSKAKLGGSRPFDPLCAESLLPLQKDSNVQKVARGIAASRDFESLPILGDALEEAGCTDKRLLAHCRKPGEHGCGCWAVNLLLGDAPAFCRSQ
jgi:cell wall assembly regulator SMI1